MQEVIDLKLVKALQYLHASDALLTEPESCHAGMGRGKLGSGCLRAQAADSDADVSIQIEGGVLNESA